MKEILVYVEGGGDNAAQRAELRQGFDTFLREVKNKARDKGVSLRFVFSGRRTSARDAFMATHRQNNPNVTPVLLVDSEESPPPLILPRADELKEQKKERFAQDAPQRKNHLTQRRDDQWDLRGVSHEQIHLIGCCLESLFCADPEGLKEFYGNNFHVNKLPSRHNLEEEPKTAIYQKLASATKDTTKGEYSESNNSKIRHAKGLLEKISLEKVRGRCPHFDAFVTYLEDLITET